jgi:hypothetical protein
MYTGHQSCDYVLAINFKGNEVYILTNSALEFVSFTGIKH